MTKKNIGGYYPVNLEIDYLEILKELYSDYIIIKNKKSSIIGVNPQINSNIKQVL